VPTGAYLDVEAGSSTNLPVTCGARDDGLAVCWSPEGSYAVQAKAGRFTKIAVGESQACALRDDGDFECWRARRTIPGASAAP
jgi:hypothetical protein